MSKNCIFCQTELEDDAIFCDECGKKQEIEKEDTTPSKEEMVLNEEPVAPIVEQENRIEEKKAGKTPNWKAGASLVLGIISSISTVVVILIPLVFGIVGLVLGIQGLKSKRKGMAIAGIILNLIPIFFYLSAVFAGFLGI